MPADVGAAPTRSPISRTELVALLAMMVAIVAFSIDAMLPVLPEIGTAVNPADPQRAQLVIASFVIGMGLGTLFTGPLCDAYGRRTVALVGAVIYSAAALSATMANDLDHLLAARFVQGLGAAGPRIAAMAMIRDLFAGRQMARITGFIMMIFSLVPVFAPSLGALIGWAFGWRAIFAAFAVFAFLVISWLMLRQPETLPPESRRPFRVGKIVEALGEVFRNRQVVLAILVQTLIFGILFAALLSSQAVFDEVYDKAASFPVWFGAIAALSSSAGLLNAVVVMRIGMRNVVKWSLLVQATLTALFLLGQITIWQGEAPPFPMAFLFLLSVFFMAGLGIGNMNAIALEPMGHIAGLASSVVAASATVASVVLAAPVGQAFNGTMIPMTVGVLVFGTSGFLLTLMLKDSEA